MVRDRSWKLRIEVHESAATVSQVESGLVGDRRCLVALKGVLVMGDWRVVGGRLGALCWPAGLKEQQASTLSTAVRRPVGRKAYLS